MKDDKHRELNKTIRQLKAQVRSLRKENKECNAKLELLHLLWAEDVDEMREQRREKIEEKRKPACPQCGNKTLTTTYIGVWVLQRCGSCEYFDRTQTEDD